MNWKEWFEKWEEGCVRIQRDGEDYGMPVKTLYKYFKARMEDEQAEKQKALSVFREFYLNVQHEEGETC